MPVSGKFLDTSATIKRSDIKDHIKSVKQQNRQKGPLGTVSGSVTGNSSVVGSGSIESNKRARSMQKNNKFID